MQVQGERQDIGIVVDAVNEVLAIPASDTEPLPAIGPSVRTGSGFIQGVGRVRGRFVVMRRFAEPMMPVNDSEAPQTASNTAP